MTKYSERIEAYFVNSIQTNTHTEKIGKMLTSRFKINRFLNWFSKCLKFGNIDIFQIHLYE
ncbi:MAG: hypothetical protein D6732_08595 [Methanobacteriota archaeon]|nr:MAG: hypothetical protein D6732_08595 [Euryarchaeota archaeon]